MAKKKQTQFVTMKIPHNGDVSALLSFRKEQSKVYRLAYKMVSRGLTELQIRHDLKKLNIGVNVDSWLIQSAIKKATGQFKADFELDQINGTDVAGKRIFGGKKNFYDRLNGKISQEEFRTNRIENFKSIGEAPRKGNRKASFNTDSITIKPKQGIKVEIPLPSLRGKFKQNYDKIVELTSLKKMPVTVEVNESFIYLSFDANFLKDEKRVKAPIKGRHLGVDLNPNYIGVSFYDQRKAIIDTRLYNFKSLTGKNINHDKLKHEIREVAIQIGKMAQHYQLEYLFVEELKFKQGDKNKGKNFNRLTSSQFLYKEFIRMLSKYGKVVEVNAAYTSTIGNIMNDQYPDPIAASMEVARRGIESRVVKGSNAFYPPMVSHSKLQNRWKEEEVPEFETWIELHNWLKTGVRYRVPIPEVGMFRVFNSKQSKVLVL